MSKRVADWLEKASVASFAVGVFQGRAIGLLLSALCFGASLYLTWKGEA